MEEAVEKEYDGSEPLKSPINERFAQAVVDSKSKSDAYRLVFDKPDLTPESVWTLSSKLSNDIKVASRIRFLRKTLTDECIWTREDSVRALKEIVASEVLGEDGKTRKEALAKDRVAASIALNKMHGYEAPIKTEITGANGSPLGLAEFFKVKEEQKN